MPKPSASPSISNTAIVAMAELSAPTDFASYRNKTISNTKERLQFEQDYMVFHVQQHFAGNDDVLEMFDTIFKQMKRAAAREYPTPMDVGAASASSSSCKRPVGDFDDEEEPLVFRKKPKVSIDAPKSPKLGKAGKAVKDNHSQQTENKPRGQNGMNLFVSEHTPRLQRLGFVKRNTFNEGIYRWSLMQPSEKELYQLKVGPLNLHHNKMRSTVEADPNVKAANTNKRLNELWDKLDAACKQVYVAEFEELPLNKAKNIKVPTDKEMPAFPEDIRNADGQIPKDFCNLADGTKVNFHESKEGKDKEGKVCTYTDAEKAKERYDAAKAYLNSLKNEDKLDEHEDVHVATDAAAPNSKATDDATTSEAEEAIDEAEEAVDEAVDEAVEEAVEAEESEDAVEKATSDAANAIVDDNVGDEAAAAAIDQAVSVAGSAPGSPMASVADPMTSAPTTPVASAPASSPPQKPKKGGVRRRA